MDPQTYCQRALDELLARGADLASDPDAVQKGAVLAYLVRLPLSKQEFARELKELRIRAVRSRRPSLEAAARAILLDWETRASWAIEPLA